jgi:transposase
MFGAHVRVTTVFNRLLGFAGTVVEAVTWSDTQIVVAVRLRSRVLVCPCGRTSRARYDSSRRRWRHVNLGRWVVIIEGDIRRVDCRGCGQVRSEWLPWARPGSRLTRDVEDMAAWLAARMSKTAVVQMMGICWRTVTAIVTRLVAAHLDTDRLAGLYRIGVDEIAYKKGRKFLTLVTDHDTGHVVWLGEGRSQTVLAQFYETLDPAGRDRVQAVSMDMTRIYREATRTWLPNATICFDPFHVIVWAGDALHTTFLAADPKAATLTVEGLTTGQAWRKVRATLRAAANNLDPVGQQIIEALRKRYPKLHRAWRLKERLRDLYRSVEPADAVTYLKKWITSALRSNINAFVTLAHRIRRNLDGITAAVHHGLSNSLTEGINAGIRLLQRQANGYAKLDNLITMIYLRHGGTPLRLPTEPS